MSRRTVGAHQLKEIQSEDKTAVTYTNKIVHPTVKQIITTSSSKPFNF